MEPARNRRLFIALVASLAVFPAATSRAADAVMEPVRVCEALLGPGAYDGRAVALLGRFSFRESGRFLSEETCGKELKTGGVVWPPAVRLAEDSKSAPRPDGGLQIDAAAMDRKLAAVRERTALRRYAFGSPEYDRWAIVYGRLEVNREFANPSGGAPEPGRPLLPGTLLYRGDGVVLFIHDR